MNKIFLKSVASLILLLFTSVALAKDPTLSQAEKLYEQKRYQDAADVLAPEVTGGAKAGPATLLLYGKCLDKMTEQINTDAEMKCYRRAGAPRTPQCMRNYAASLNAKYGAGSFEYVHDIITIKYTGAQFDRLGAEFPGSSEAGEADYLRLTKNLIGHPSVVLPRIREFVERHPSGEWHRKGLLLLARINEDVWWIHRNWAWLLYNWEISDEDLIVRAEKYRQAAMENFKMVKGGKEGKIAKKELKMLQKYKSDGKMYGIINESDISGVVVRPTKPPPRP